MNVATVECLLATDNESYTYNKRVNHIPPIAQHHMILRALAHVTEERIASALNVSVAEIREKRDLLKGICPETTEILRDQRVSAEAFCALRKLKPIRQIEVARLMISARKFSGRFAKALLDGTREDLLSRCPRRDYEVTPSQQSMMEQETDEFLKHVESIKASYGTDVIDLTAACRIRGTTPWECPRTPLPGKTSRGHAGGARTTSRRHRRRQTTPATRTSETRS